MDHLQVSQGQGTQGQSGGSSHSTATAGMLGSPFSAAAALGLNPLAAYGSAGIAGMPGLQGFPLGAGGSPFGQTGLRLGAGANLNPATAHLASPGQLPGVGLSLNGALGGVSGSGSVLLVSNLDENLTECDHLFILFGVYGDVQRVKILFNKKDTALVQMSEPQQALLAMNHLDKTKLWGKAIRVMPSKHTTVQFPKDGQPDAGLTKDYGNSNLHRFKKPGSKNYSNIYPPSATLHLSNIPSTIEEADLRT